MTTHGTIYSAFFIAEEGHHGLRFVDAAEMGGGRPWGQVLLALCRLGHSHYWQTPEADSIQGRQGQSNARSDVPCSKLGIELIPGSIRRRPGAARSACSAPCRNALPQELELAGITDDGRPPTGS